MAVIVDIPDRYVGGDILPAVYAGLNIAVEFEDVPGKRAMALSCAGELDGAVPPRFSFVGIGTARSS
jgi:polar amino acid transport system substrate-binding protein